MVLEARSGDGRAARLALEELCRLYWYPLYAFLRRRGHVHHEAEDLVQGLFCQLLSGAGLAGVDREKGKFRSYLLSALKNHVANQHRRATAQKRGGGRSTISIDGARAAGRYEGEPAAALTPEDCFEREWALTVLEQAFELVRESYRARGREAVFEQLRGFVTGDGPATSHEELAHALEMTPGSTRVLVHRFRARFGGAVRDVVAQTVSDDPAALEEEIGALMACFGR